MNKTAKVRNITILLVVIFALGAGAFLFVRETAEKPVAPKLDSAGATPQSISETIKANNKFALSFYSNLKDKEKGNIFFSPYSISTALSMVYEGARGRTADEIQSVFSFLKSDSLRRSSVAAFYNRLNKKGAGCKLYTANALWVQKDYSLLNEFLQVIRNYYGGEARNVDFKKALEKARLTINRWVESKTNGKIKNLFPQSSLAHLTRLVLTNTIYFKGKWAKQFDKSKTRKEDFMLSDSKKIRVPMMRQIGEEAKFNYTETKETQVLELPYKGNELSMLVILPKSPKLNDLEKRLTLERLSKWRKSLKKQRVDVYLPKFILKNKYFLNENLKEMGMLLAFMPPSPTGGADFSGISGERDLFIGIVIHQAFVDVDEEGTEAAAATGVGFDITSIWPGKVPVFRADHPFIFLIQEKESGNILFMGRVENPSI